MIKGQIIKGISGFYYVDTGSNLYECKARGVFRKENIVPMIGDFVDINVLYEEDKKGIIENIYNRKSELKRPPISNIDKAIIVFAIKNPNINFSLLDRFLILSERENLNTIIVITKTDLAEVYLVEEAVNIYESCGYKVICVSNLNKTNIDEVKDELASCTAVIAGPSGSGKSSLLNEIDENLKLKTGVLSEKIKRGKHTTRHAELYKLQNGGMVADTPGFSSLSLEDIEEDELKYYFIEFEEYSNCKYGANCLHQSEPCCGVKEALRRGHVNEKRYNSYIQLLDEINKNNSRRY